MKDGDSQVSAKATLRMDAELADSGTARKSIVTFYGHGSPLTDFLEQEWGTRRMSDLRFRLWNLAAIVRHWFGIHTWVALEDWSLSGEYIRAVGHVCWRCPRRTE
jgi:hypothetical protein